MASGVRVDDRTRNVLAAARNATEAGCYRIAEDIANEAIRLLNLDGYPPGQASKRRAAGLPLHSKPGDPPFKLTGNLAKSVQALPTREEGGRFVAYVVAGAEYAAPDEFGAPSINLAPRPFMRPALDRSRNAIAELVGLEIARSIDARSGSQ